MDFYIRNATMDDAKHIAELSAELGYPSSKEDTQSRLKKMLTSPDHCIYVAMEGDDVIGWVHGFCTMRVESDRFVEIGGLVIGQEHQKKGIGKKLVSQVCTWSQSKQCQTVRVRCNVIRTESHKFYERLGFTTNKEQKIFVKSLK
ncbi:MAG: GNAT family N-acetyltransferase [Gelidibacter sp.]